MHAGGERGARPRAGARPRRAARDRRRAAGPGDGAGDRGGARPLRELDLHRRAAIFLGASDPDSLNSISSKQATVKSPHNFPLYDNIGDKDILPGFGSLPAII